MYLMITIIMFIMTLKMTTNYLAKKKTNMKFSSNIECGFNSMNNKKINFSLNFMFIMIIFILFDIELMILVPLILTNKMNMKFELTTNMFLIFIMTSTLMEMKNKKIKWML